MSEDQSEYLEQALYIRMRGRVQGPFRMEQLQALHQRGQFSKAHEISDDRVSWRSAATLKNIFVAPKTTRLPPLKAPAPVVDENFDADPEYPVEKSPEFLTPGPAKMVKPIWHYSVGKETYGPVTVLELRGLLAGGQLMPSDLVWKDGLADWMPAAEVSELSGSPDGRGAGSDRPGFSQFNYCSGCGKQVAARAEICPNCGVRQLTAVGAKSRMLTALLAFFFGAFGIHRFYLNQPILGLAYPISAFMFFIGSVTAGFLNIPVAVLILFVLSWLPFFVSIIEAIVFLCMTDAAFSAHHNRH